MQSLEITIPIPPRETHPNRRVHWSTKSKAVKAQRRDAGFAALAALQTAGMPKPRWQSAQIQATFYDAANTANIADEDNLIAWLKATVDGIADAGVLDNDRGLKWLPTKQYIRSSAAGERKVVLLLTPSPPAG